MKIIKKVKNSIRLIPETTDDLYILSKLLKGTEIEAKTDRKIEIKGTDKHRRVSIFVRIKVESLEFEAELEILKANGRIVFSKPEEFAPIGAYQSIDIKIGNSYLIEFERLTKSILDMLEQEKAPKTMIILLDDEKAQIALLSNLELKKVGEILSGKSGKQFESEKYEDKYFKKLKKIVEEKNPEYLIIAGPGFTKEKFSEYLGDKFPHQIIGTSHIDNSGFKELLKSNLKKTLQSLQILRDTKLLEKFYEDLAKNSKKLIYGKEEVKRAIELNACSLVLISEDVIEEFEDVLKNKNIDVKIISSRHDAGKEFKNFQAAAFLYYPLS